MSWSVVCSSDDVWEGDLAGHAVDGHEVVLVRLEGGTLRAYQGICPHQEIRLCEGDLYDAVLECRGHRWQFDAATGEGVNPADCALATYPVEERDGKVYVDVAGVVPLHSF